jgi:hypothetical protein
VAKKSRIQFIQGQVRIYGYDRGRINTYEDKCLTRVKHKENSTYNDKSRIQKKTSTGEEQNTYEEKYLTTVEHIRKLVPEITRVHVEYTRGVPNQTLPHPPPDNNICVQLV